MPRFSIAFDNSNEDLGHYFEQSKADLIDYLNATFQAVTITEIDSLRCNPAFIDIHLPTVNLSNFFFVAYSHGHENRLVAQGDYYIKSLENSYLFTNCFFYSMSCWTAIDLGPNLVENGSHAFIGYGDEVRALLEEYMPMSIACDNFGIKKFIEGQTLQESVKLMKENFNSSIDELMYQGEPLRASYLRRSRDALGFHGNPDLTVDQFLP